ncbi:diacylglycerol kinase [Flavobacterium sp.]|jgi:diacylglycerol kinase (ATP)|uniref:diacylglycerol kinase n=1 Tax=Flavobacterium sp. TaxID=239 RepID=UPI0037BFBD1A
MEFQRDKKFISGRFKSLGFALKGAVKLATTEHSVMVQSSIAVLLVIAGFYFEISREEWMFQTLAIGLVLAIEGLNTAVEKVADFIHPEFHEKIGFIKDIAAGAVFFAAMTAITIGCFIYIPKF